MRAPNSFRLALSCRRVATITNASQRRQALDCYIRQILSQIAMGLRRSNRGSFAPRKLLDRVLSSAGFAHLAHVQFDLIYVAPAPIFAGLKRLHDGMLGAMKMLGCMLVFRRIATTHMPAFQTQAQMNPGVAHFQTFLAAIWCAGCDR